MRFEKRMMGLTRREGRVGQPLWQSQWFLLAVVILMSLTDFSTLFSILDSLTVTSKYLGMLITASAAFLLNLMPVLVAETLLRGQGQRWKAVAPGLGFVLLFGLQAFLRWQTRDMLVTEGGSVITFQMDGQVGTSAGGAATQAVSQLSAADTAMCVFLMMLPLCTSLVCFGLALLGKTPAERAAWDRRVLQQKRRHLAAKIEAEVVMMDACQHKMETLREQELECRNAALAELEAERKMAQAIAMEELAKATHSDGQMLDEITYTGQYHKKELAEVKEGKAG